MRERAVKIFEDMVAGFDGIEVKGKATRYTAMNGNMFSFVDGDGLLCIRLSTEDKAAYEAAHGTSDVLQYGSVMRGYVPVLESMLDDQAALRALFTKAVENAKSLKPKATTKKK